jgi:uncharacterized protein (DUF697 family)
MSRKDLAGPDPGATERVYHAIVDFVSKIPKSSVRKARDPLAAARARASAAARSAALTAGSLALPPGPLGWITILPEILGVWKIQAQMVADIARMYGRSASLTREHMLYCLFRHSAAQVVRDLVVQSGERLLVQQASVRVIQGIARRVGVRVSERGLASGVSRWLPIVGAVGVGGYAYYDTKQVAKTAIDLFGSETAPEAAPKPRRPRPRRIAPSPAPSP